MGSQTIIRLRARIAVSRMARIVMAAPVSLPGRHLSTLLSLVLSHTLPVRRKGHVWEHWSGAAPRVATWLALRQRAAKYRSVEGQQNNVTYQCPCPHAAIGGIEQSSLSQR